MTSQPILAPAPPHIYSPSSNPSHPEGIFDTSGYSPQSGREIAAALLAQIDIPPADIPDDYFYWNRWAPLWNQGHPAAIPLKSEEPPPSTGSAAATADPYAAPFSTPIPQEIETNSLPSNYFNLPTTSFTTGLVGIALRNILRPVNPVTASFDLGSITGLPYYARLQITPPLTQLFNIHLEAFRIPLFNPPILEALDRTEVEYRLQQLEESGQPYIAPRLRALQKVDEDDEDDVPLNDQAVLGFLDFIEAVFTQEADLGLATAQGWLCAQWKYSDGRILVLWLKNRTDSMLTALDSQRQILRHIGADPKAGTLESASQLLVQEGFFCGATSNQRNPPR